MPTDFSNPWSYADIATLKAQASATNPIVASMSVPDFSSRLNSDYGTTAFNAGTPTGFGGMVNQISGGLDQLINATGLPQVSSDLFRLAGQPIGEGDYLSSIGAGVPRGIANLAPLFVAPEAELPGLFAKLGASAGLGAASTYGETGSPGAAAVAAASNIVMPFAGGLGKSIGLKLAGAGLDEAGNLAASTVGQRVAGFAGEQAAATGVGLAANQVGNLHVPTMEELLGSVAGNVPFAALSLPDLFHPLYTPTAARDATPIGATPEGDSTVGNVQTATAGAAQRVQSDDTTPLSVPETPQEELQPSPVLQEPVSPLVPEQNAPSLLGFDTTEPNLDFLTGAARSEGTSEEPQIPSTEGAPPEPVRDRPALLSFASDSQDAADAFSAAHQASQDSYLPISLQSSRDFVANSVNADSGHLYKTPVEEALVRLKNKTVVDQTRQLSDADRAAATLAARQRGITEIGSGEKAVKAAETVQDRAVSASQLSDPYARAVTDFISKNKDKQGGMAGNISEQLYHAARKMEVAGIAPDSSRFFGTLQRALQNRGVSYISKGTAERVEGEKFDNQPDAQARATELTGEAQPGEYFSAIGPTKGETKWSILKQTKVEESLPPNLEENPETQEDIDNAAVEAAFGENPSEGLREIGSQLQLAAQSGENVTGGAAHFEDAMRGLLHNTIDSMPNKLLAEQSVAGSGTEEFFKTQRQRLHVIAELMMQKGFVKEAGGTYFDSILGRQMSKLKIDTDKLQTVLSEMGGLEWKNEDIKTADQAKSFRFSLNEKTGRLFNRMMSFVQGSKEFSDLTNGVREFQKAKDETRGEKTSPELHLLEQTFNKLARTWRGKSLFKLHDSPFDAARDATPGDPTKMKDLRSAARAGAESMTRIGKDEIPEIYLFAKNIKPRPWETSYSQAINRVLWTEAASGLGLHEILGSKFFGTLRVVGKDIPLAEREAISKLYGLKLNDEPKISAQALTSRGPTDPSVLQFHRGMQSAAKERGLDFSLQHQDMPELLNNVRNRFMREAGVLRPSDDNLWISFARSPNPLDSYSSHREFSSLGAAFREGLTNPPKDLAGQLDMYHFMVSDAMRSGIPQDEAERQAFMTMKVMLGIKGVDSYHFAVLSGEDKNLLGISMASAEDPTKGRLVALRAGLSGRDNLRNMTALIASHELMEHALDFGNPKDPNSPVGRMWAEAKFAVDQMLPETRQILLRDLVHLAFGGKIDNAEKLAGFLKYSRDDSKEFIMTIMGLLSNVAHGSSASDSERFSKLRDILNYAPQWVGNLARVLLKNVSTLAQRWLGMRQAEDLGLNPRRFISDVEKEAIGRLMNVHKGLVKMDDEHQRDIDQFTQMLKIGRDQFDGYLQGAVEAHIISDVDRGESPLVGYARAVPIPSHDEMPKKLNFLQREVQLPAHFAEDNPWFQPWYKAMRGAPAVAQLLTNKVLSPFGFKLEGSKFVKDTKGMAAFKTVRTDPEARNALSDLMRKSNEKVDKNEGPLTQEDLDAFRQNEGKSLSNNQWSAILGNFDKAKQGNIELGQAQARGKADFAATMLAHELMFRSEGRHVEDAMGFRDQLAKALYENSPYEIPDVFKQYMNTDQQAAFASRFSDLQEATQNLANMMSQREGYFNEQRQGKYQVSYVSPEGTTSWVGAKNMDEVRRWQEFLESEGHAQKGTVKYVPDPGRNDNVKISVPEETFAAIQAFQEKAFANLEGVIGKDATDAVRANLDIAEQAHADYVERDLVNWMKRRKLAGGREFLDMMANHVNHASNVPFALMRAHLRNSASILRRSSSLDHAPDYRQYAERQLESMLHNTPAAARAIKELVFQYNMALNPSSSLIELTQSIATVPYWLQKHGANFVQANRELAGAWKTVVQAGWKGEFKGELGVLMKRLTDLGVGTHGRWDEYDDTEDNLPFNIQQITATGNLLDKAKGGMKNYLEFTRNLYGMSSFLSNKMAIVAGYNRGKTLGMSGEALEDFVIRTVHNTMHGGGKVNQIPFGSGGRTPFDSSMRASMTALQQYTVGVMGMMGQAIRDGLRGNRAQKIAAAQLLGTQFALSGLLGMPFVTAGLAILEQMFPEVKAKEALHQLPHKLLGEGPLQNYIGDMLLYGVPTASSPIDVTSRLGLSSMLGVSDYSGINAGDFLGPSASIVENAFKATQSLQGGNLELAAEQIAPVFVRNILKAVKDGGVVKDYSGSMVGQLMGQERLLQGLGFRPKALSQYQEQAAEVSRVKKVDAMEQQREVEEQAQNLSSGRPDLVLQKMSENLKNNPAFDLKSYANQIADRSVDMTSPTSLGSGGSPRTADEIASILRGDIGTNEMSEQARLVKKNNYLASLGIPGLGITSPTAVKRAQLVDGIRAVHPGVTIDQAREAAEAYLRSIHPDASSSLLSQ